MNREANSPIVKYVSDNAVEIDYTVDSWATWFDKWKVKPCYVLREHVNAADDIVGKYVQEEGLQEEYQAGKENPKVLEIVEFMNQMNKRY